MSQLYETVMKSSVVPVLTAFFLRRHDNSFMLYFLGEIIVATEPIKIMRALAYNRRFSTLGSFSKG